MGHARSAQLARDIGDETALIVVVQPVFEVVQSRQIFSSANAPAIAVQFDVMQQTLWRPVFFWLVQHPREGERDFEKRPAIHSQEIGRGRFDSIVDLKRVMAVTRSDQRFSNRGGPENRWSERVTAITRLRST